MDSRDREVTRWARKIVGPLAITLVVGAAYTDAFGGRGEGVVVGNRAPAELGFIDHDRVGVVWVLRSDDCLRCEATASAAGFRVLIRRAQDRIDLNALVIGETSAVQQLSQFLVRERLPMPIFRITDRQYRNAFGRSATPAIYVVYRDTIKGMWNADTAGTSNTTVQEMVEILSRAKDGQFVAD